MAKTVCEKLLTIPGHKEMQIKTTVRFHLTGILPVYLPSRTPPTNGGSDVKKKEPSYIASGNVNYYNHFGKQYGVFLNNLA
jgi:hypothetical protein